MTKKKLGLNRESVRSMAVRKEVAGAETRDVGDYTNYGCPSGHVSCAAGCTVGFNCADTNRCN